MKVLIVEASYPKDFFSERLDGHVTHHLTKLFRIESNLIYTLDPPHFQKAIDLAAQDGYDVLHLSCHGDDNGIALTNKANIDWPEFAAIFQEKRYKPAALVMSACCGASDGLADEFEKQSMRPNIIFGSIDERGYNEYAVAWTILYNKFQSEGVHRDVAQEALKEINAIVHHHFRYLRWDNTRRHYLNFPGTGKRYEVTERIKRRAR